jgi:putative ABC transport system ATP-binding protein
MDLSQTGAVPHIPRGARARAVTKIYGHGPAAVTALDAVSLDIAAGSFIAVMGPSGSGKSTLMHCMAGLDAVTSGRIWIGDTELSPLRERQLTRLRRDRVGFVFQAYNLLPVLTAARTSRCRWISPAGPPTRSG